MESDSMASIIFSPKDIFEQEFKTSMRGYDRREVDEFLDDVIKDYETYQAQLAELRAENDRLNKQLLKHAQIKPGESRAGQLERTITDGLTPADIKNVAATADTQTVTPVNSVPKVSNLDLLRRISRLEKEVFGKQISEED